MIILFFTFAKIGLFTFGGGYAMISLIEDICVEKNKWITHDEMMKITVIAESTPGPIAINCATFIGYRQRGILGAISATLGVVTPSFIIIYLISVFLQNFLEIQIIANAFKGIRIAVGIMILDASIKMIKKMKKSVFSYVVIGCSFAIMFLSNIFSWGIPSTVLMIAAAIIGLCMAALPSSPFEKGGEIK